jgi:hypothetical protein
MVKRVLWAASPLRAPSPFRANYRFADDPLAIRKVSPRQLHAGNRQMSGPTAEYLDFVESKRSTRSISRLFE